MQTDFTPTSNAEASALIAGKPVVTREVFDRLLPELRGRAFTITGIESANILQRVRDTIATLPAGSAWADVKQDIAAELDPYLGDRANQRAELLLRTHGFQAFHAALYETAQADENTTHLQYVATQDNHVRAEHLALDGLILPKDDPFWETHTPPWDWGCRCRIRPLTQELVDEAAAEDEHRAPDARRIPTPAIAEQLRNGSFTRSGEHFNVTPPRDRPGADATAFQWNPHDLRIPLEELKKRYDPEVFAAFEKFAKAQKLAQGTLWEMLENGGKSSPNTNNSANLKGINAKRREEHSKGEMADPASALESSADFTRGGIAPVPDHDASESQRAKRIANEQQRLINWARTNKKLGGPVPAEDVSGGEHIVRLEDKSGRVIKATNPDRQKGYGIALGSHTHGATPAEYLDRLALQNKIFDDDIRLERVVVRNGKPIIVTSQTALEGKHPSQAAIDELMREKGYEQFIGGAYYNAQEGLLIYDLLPKNAIQIADGTILPFDPVIQRIDTDFAAFLRDNSHLIHNR